MCSQIIINLDGVRFGVPRVEITVWNDVRVFINWFPIHVYIRTHEESRRAIKKPPIIAKRNSNKWSVFFHLYDCKREAVRRVPLAIQRGNWGAASCSDLRFEHLQQRRLTKLKLIL